MAPIRVLLADDHAVIREGLRHILNGQKDMEVIGEEEDGQGALKRVRELKPDILLLDIAMPGLNGLEALRLIRNASPNTKVIIFSMHNKEGYVDEAIGSGALGYVLKSSPPSEVVAAVRVVQEKKYFLSPKIEDRVVKHYLEAREKSQPASGYDLLSAREQEVFRMLVEGEKMKEISTFLCVSPKTVEKHRTNIGKKLGIHDTFGLVKYAIKIGVIDPEAWDS